MATSSTEKLQTLLKCPICRVNLTHPKAFLCSHFYCQSCIDGFELKTEESVSRYQCPICRRITPRDKLRAMHFIQDLLDIVNQAKNEDTFCDQCKYKVPDRRCIECKENLCEPCIDKHDRWPVMKQHKWQEMANNSHTIVDKQVFCQTHRGKLVALHCKDCQELICVLCIGTEHKYHQVETIEAALDGVLPPVRENKERLQTLIDKNETELATVKTEAEGMQKQYNDMEQEIDAKAEEMINRVKADAEAAKQKLHDYKVEHIKETAGLIIKFEQQLKSQHNIVALTDTTLSCVQGTSLLQTIQSDIHEGLLSNLWHEATATKIETQVRAKFKASTESQGNVVGGVTEVKNSFSKFIDRPLKHVANTTFRLVKDCALNCKTYRFAAIDDRMWFVEMSSNRIHICSFDGNEIQILTVNNITICQSVAPIPGGVVVAASDGLYRTDRNAQNLVRLINTTSDIVDVSTTEDMIVALNDSEGKVHILKLDERTNSYNEHRVIRIHGYKSKNLNTIQVSTRYIYVAQWSSHTILRYNRDSQNVKKHSMGSYGTDIFELNHPWLCASDAHNTVLVADQDNHCLKMLSKDGDWRVLQIPDLQHPTCAHIEGNDLYVSRGVHGYQHYSAIKQSN